MTTPSKPESRTGKHTAGQWSYFREGCRKRGEAEFVIDGPPGGDHGQFSHEPHARLIAAAPELLLMLKSFLEFHPIVNGSKTHRGNFQNWKDHAEKIIAKAEGHNA